MTTPHDVLDYIDRVNHAVKKFREPIESAAFLEWVRVRQVAIRAEMDAHPQIDHGGHEIHPTALLLREIGWDSETGRRRLDRWRTGSMGIVERSVVEDALDHAGVAFWEVYPDVPRPKFTSRFGLGRKLTDAQVLAAYTIYTRQNMSIHRLSAMLWERFGYASQRSCATALFKAFQGMGLERRRCAGVNQAGVRCERSPKDGSVFCAEHGGGVRPSVVGSRASVARRVELAWQPDARFVARARRLYVEGGLSMRAVGLRMVAETPLRSADYLAQRLAQIAKGEGWQRPTCKSGVVYELPDRVGFSEGKVAA